MNNSDEAFLEKLRITFRIEAEEHLKALTDGLLLLEKNQQSLVSITKKLL